MILIIPNISNAATEYTYIDEEQSVEWGYDIDDSGNIVKLKCRTTSVKGTITIPSISLSENLTSIGSYAFKDCSGIKSITIPNSVTFIGEDAFWDCSGLKEVSLSENLSQISDGTFLNCTGLTSIIISESVTTIEGPYQYSGGAFGKCKNLKKVLIPDTVASIGGGAFRGCDKLTIYGNDGMVSKEYAEENGFVFDYIANWDKEENGADITAPTVQEIKVTYASVMKYDRDSNRSMYIVPADAKLVINVSFSEVVEGTTVPTLTIKFGDGENIHVTEGTVAGSVITYIYTIKNTDKGIMTTVDYSGGNIKDVAGNGATLSCPALTIQYSSNDFVYANGIVTNPDNGVANEDDSSSGTNEESNNESGQDSNIENNNVTEEQKTNKDTTSKSEENKQDTTTATGKIPYAGAEFRLIVAIVCVISVAVLAYFRYRQIRDI